MINNINYTIKFDYEAFCKQYVENIKTIYDVDVENIPNDINVITKWVEKVQEDDLIEHLKNDDLTTVIKLMEVRK